MEPGMSIFLVAGEADITASLLFQWHKTYTEGSLVAVGANELVVPASELREAMRRLKQLEAVLGCCNIKLGMAFLQSLYILCLRS
jgi:transposase